MSSDEQRQYFKQILEEIERHQDLYRFVEFKSVIARRESPLSREGKWHNFVTLIKMLHFSSPSPWKKHVEKDNFAILSAVLMVEDFKETLMRLVNDQVLDIDGYQAFGPFNFEQKDFLDSEQAKNTYGIDWAVNIWRVSGKENLGLPDSRKLELESEDVPFSDPRDAIRYYTGLSLQSDSSLQNTIHIIAPLFYARIKKVNLSGRELLVEIDSNLVNAQDLRIGYNTQGPDERPRYLMTLEANTVQPAGDTTTIQLRKDAEYAVMWLFHVAGYKIDSRRARKAPSIERIEVQLSQESPQLWDEDLRVINETIDSTLKTRILDLATMEQGVDSIDIEILKAVKTQGGDYAKFMPEILKFLSLNMLLLRLARLRALGFVTLQYPRKVLLTSQGLDALNLPPSVLSANVPSEVATRIAEIQLAFRQENFDEVTNKSTKLLEIILREELNNKFPITLQDVWPNLKLEPYERASLGTLREACLRLNVIASNSVADHLLSVFLKLRVPMSHEKEGGASPSGVAFLTVKLVEAFARDWYYLKL